jgi:hypothetical protein
VHAIFFYEGLVDEHSGRGRSSLFTTQDLQTAAKGAQEDVELRGKRRPQIGIRQTEFCCEAAPRTSVVAGQPTMSRYPDAVAMLIDLNIPDIIVDEAIGGGQELEFVI